MKQIPNIITCLNLLAGCMACVLILRFNNSTGAFIFIVLAGIFDFLDGMAARALKAYSNIGAELDSLADVVSFGLAPGCIVYSYLSTYDSGMSWPLIAFLLPVFSALRLAKFNVDTRQSTSFLGLPVPASGLFWTSLIPSIHLFFSSFSLIVPVGIVILLFVFCLLMISEIPMFSLKFKNLQWKGNEWPFSLIGISIIVIFLCVFNSMPLVSLSIIILIYILLSLVKVIFGK
ncbi:CDP-diacylglycerol--serine O-phosphatidyltransferase [Bacteroidia bacterium]|nr:CDP-diacylglycerol--serine O-phosphatidyltransferase [Bacteroidia bacterium]